MKLFVAIILVMSVLSYVTPLVATDAAAGKELYGKKCASCHGAAGEGKDSVAKTFKVEMRHLGAKEVQSKSDAELKKLALEGTGKMKGVKDLNAKGANDIVTYIRTLKK